MNWRKIFALAGIVATGTFGMAACGDDDGTAPLTPPLPATNVGVTVNGTSLTVTWTPGDGAVYQRVELSATGETKRTAEKEATDASHTFENLTPGKTYAAQVFSLNAAGETGSAVAVGTIDEAACVGAPDAPGGVAASVSGTTVTVSWSASACADSYRVELSTEGEDTRTNTAGASATSSAFTDLTPGKTYTGQVYAINANGETASAAAQVTVPEGQSGVIVISSRITEDVTWTSDNTYVLNGAIFLGEDCGPDPSAPLASCKAVTLTIEPGTTILGVLDPPAPARSSFLVVTRGSRLVADANADRADKQARPNEEDVIVFTSAAAPGARARTNWGGIIINGRADINNADEAAGEGGTGLYGGVDDNDDSGILRGVRVEFAGDNFTETDQLNGIAFQGVGAGTIVDYLQVHYNEDDGIEPFGGAVSIFHSVMTGIGDDSYDGTDGYRGIWQYGIAQQRADAADQGFELSTAGDNPTDSDFGSTAVVANFTVVGAKHFGEIAQQGASSDYGLLLREGANWRVFNTLVTGFGRAGFCIEKDGTDLWATNQLDGTSSNPNETVRTEGTIVWGNGSDGPSDPLGVTTNLESRCAPADEYERNAEFFQNGAFRNLIADAGLPASAFSIGSRTSPPSFIPPSMPGGYQAATFADITNGLVLPVDATYRLEATDYAGAVEPGTALTDAWYYGWTVWTTNGTDSRPTVEIPNN